MEHIKEMVKGSLTNLADWIEDHNYKGYEPFDGLSSFLHPLTFHNLFCERLLQQLVRRSPVNLRPLLGIRPQESTKGKGYMARGYLLMFQATGAARFRDKAVEMLSWLQRHKAPGYTDYCWGNHFDFCSRGGRLPKLEPIIVWTSLIGQAFLDAYETFADERYLDVSRSICDWIMALPRERTSSGTCLSYIRFKQSSIHNANMLGAAMLARTARFTDEDALRQIARDAMEYSCSRQLPDGAWLYGEAPQNHWIDNFHTGYNLDSLKCYVENTNDMQFMDNLHKGFDYYKRTFFKADGTPRYYHDRTYPVEIQCASQSIETLTNFADYEDSALALAISVAEWTIANMQDKTGYFYYRQSRWTRNKTPMLHWGQATMFCALSRLFYTLGMDSVAAVPEGRDTCAARMGE
jgi:rhamnogalacturonyl hydrolase YesR